MPYYSEEERAEAKRRLDAQIAEVKELTRELEAAEEAGDEEAAETLIQRGLGLREEVLAAEARCVEVGVLDEAVLDYPQAYEQTFDDRLPRDIPFTTKINTVFQSTWRLMLFVIIFAAVSMRAPEFLLTFDYSVFTESREWGEEAEGWVKNFERMDKHEGNYSLLRHTFTFKDAEGVEHEGQSYGLSVVEDWELEFILHKGKYKYQGGTQSPHMPFTPVEVRYDPDDPSKANIVGEYRRLQTNANMWASAGMLAASILFFIIFLWLGFRRLRFLTFGERRACVLREMIDKKYGEFRAIDAEGDQVQFRTRVYTAPDAPEECSLLLLPERPTKPFVVDVQPAAIWIDDDGVIYQSKSKIAYTNAIFFAIYLLGLVVSTILGLSA